MTLQFWCEFASTYSYLSAVRVEPLAAAAQVPLVEEAAAREIFGAPSFCVGDELFWGNERLEDAIAWCQ